MFYRSEGGGSDRSSEPQHLKNPDLGVAFVGVCEKCGLRRNEVRYLEMDSGKKKGPYDVKCGYSFKVSEVRNFVTQPQSSQEWWYRYILRRELPDDRSANRFFFRFVMSRVYWFLLVLIYLGITVPIFFSFNYLIYLILYSIVFYAVTYRRTDDLLSGLFALPLFEDLHDDLQKNKYQNYIEISDLDFHQKYLKFVLLAVIYYPKLILIVYMGVLFLLIIPFFPIIVALTGAFMFPFLLLGLLLRITKFPVLIFTYIRNRIRFWVRLVFISLISHSSVGSNHRDNFILFWQGKISSKTPPVIIHRLVFFLVVSMIGMLIWVLSLTTGFNLGILRETSKALVQVLSAFLPATVMDYIPASIAEIIMVILVLMSFSHLVEFVFESLYGIYKAIVSFSRTPEPVLEQNQMDHEMIRPIPQQSVSIPYIRRYWLPEVAR